MKICSVSHRTQSMHWVKEAKNWPIWSWIFFGTIRCSILHPTHPTQSIKSRRLGTDQFEVLFLFYSNSYLYLSWNQDVFGRLVYHCIMYIQLVYHCTQSIKSRRLRSDFTNAPPLCMNMEAEYKINPTWLVYLIKWIAFPGGRNSKENYKSQKAYFWLDILRGNLCSEFELWQFKGVGGLQ